MGIGGSAEGSRTHPDSPAVRVRGSRTLKTAATSRSTDILQQLRAPHSPGSGSVSSSAPGRQRSVWPPEEPRVRHRSVRNTGNIPEEQRDRQRDRQDDADLSHCSLSACLPACLSSCLSACLSSSRSSGGTSTPDSTTAAPSRLFKSHFLYFFFSFSFSFSFFLLLFLLSFTSFFSFSRAPPQFSRLHHLLNFLFFLLLLLRSF